jgi:hypothetical protein
MFASDGAVAIERAEKKNDCEKKEDAEESEPAHG